MQLRNKALATVVAAGLLGTVATSNVAFADRTAPGRGPKDRVSCSAPDADKARLAIVGLTSDGGLVCFAAERPDRLVPLGSVTGLVTDTALVGIDVRPATGALVGVGDAGGIYAIDPDDAAASLVSRMDVALSGASFGVDFNPAVDRLRIVSDTGQNLRVNVDTGATTTDLPLVGGTAVGAAYTNNDASPATATTLFDLTLTDQVAIQAPPNNGNLNPVGGLGVDAGPAAGFDIHSTVVDGVTTANHAYAVLTVEGSAGLYEVDLLTGAAHLRGGLPGPVVDLAIPTAQG